MSNTGSPPRHPLARERDATGRTTTIAKPIDFTLLTAAISAARNADSATPVMSPRTRRCRRCGCCLIMTMIAFDWLRWHYRKAFTRFALHRTLHAGLSRASSRIARLAAQDCAAGLMLMLRARRHAFDMSPSQGPGAVFFTSMARLRVPIFAFARAAHTQRDNTCRPILFSPDTMRWLRLQC